MVLSWWSMECRRPTYRMSLTEVRVMMALERAAEGARVSRSVPFYREEREEATSDAPDEVGGHGEKKENGVG